MHISDHDINLNNNNKITTNKTKPTFQEQKHNLKKRETPNKYRMCIRTSYTLYKFPFLIQP